MSRLKSTKGSMKVSLSCWNVLADTFAYSRPFQAKNVMDNIVTVVPEHLKWNFRKDMIGSAIQNCAADILCLQEVDHYDDFYEPFLSNIGYSTIYLQRPKRKDGCLIAYKKDNFELSAVEEIQFDDIVDFMPSDSARSNVKRSNVALIALLTNKLKPENAFVISTAHLYWNERRKEVKKMQTQYLYGRVESFLSSNAIPEQTPVVIAGDFNSIPLSEPYQMLTEGFNANVPLGKGKKESGTFYGPSTKFLCDSNLSRLCRWMRVLGIDTALVPQVQPPSADEVRNNCNNGRITKQNKQQLLKANNERIFNQAREEQRVIVTTSTSMRERALCPPSCLVSTNTEEALIEICKEYGLNLTQERFLTVCGKCGGEIEACSHSDTRITSNKEVIPPVDHDVLICKNCAQPYWWNESENSSPAMAMKMADRLYNAVIKQLDNGIQQATMDKSEIGSISFPMAATKSTLMSLPPSLSTLFAKRDEIMGPLKVMPFKKKYPSQIDSVNATYGSMMKQSIQTKVDAVPTETPIDSGNDTDVESCDSIVSPNSMLTVEDEALGESGKADLSRTFRSAYATVHGKEPLATNWNGDFKETLDYVFLSNDWLVQSAQVIPSTEVVIEGKENVDGESDERRQLLSATIDSSQPSSEWPSDHLMLLVHLEI